MLNRRKEAHKRETETGEGEGERGRETESDEQLGKAARGAREGQLEQPLHGIPPAAG